MTRIANRKAAEYVNRKEFFKGSNIFGFWSWSYGGYVQHLEREVSGGGNSLYIVTSYGNHFPMLVFDPKAEKWYHNTDKYSSTTSRHQSRVGRRGEGMTTDQLKAIIRHGGVLEAVDQRVGAQP
jgi:hypothetical protein